MARKPKPRRYSITHSSTVYGVSEDRVYDPDSDLDTSLADQLQCPIADDVLIALRKSFSMTFPTNLFVEGLKEAILEIRRIGVESLQTMPEVLQDLGLPPIPTTMADSQLGKVRLFMFVFARTDLLDISVKVNGKRRRLLDVAEHEDGTELLTTLRSVVSDTFQEAHDEDQLSEILRQIRQWIHAVLPKFNACLESMEIEPIAEMKLEDSDD